MFPIGVIIVCARRLLLDVNDRQHSWKKNYPLFLTRSACVMRYYLLIV